MSRQSGQAAAAQEEDSRDRPRTRSASRKTKRRERRCSFAAHRRCGARGSDAKALLAPARTGALQLTDAARPRAINASLQQRRRGMHEPPADGVPLRFSIGAFGWVRKRPLAAVPAKAEPSGFAATVLKSDLLVPQMAGREKCRCLDPCSIQGSPAPSGASAGV
jgi:hypothetical protein